MMDQRRRITGVSIKRRGEELSLVGAGEGGAGEGSAAMM